MNLYKIVTLVVLSVLVSILLGSAANAVTHVAEPALAESRVGGGEPGVGQPAASAGPGSLYLPIILLNAPATFNCISTSPGLTVNGGNGPVCNTDVTLALVFGGNGSANSVARSDHNHFGQSWSGTGVSEGLHVTNSSGTGLSGSGGNVGVAGDGSVAGVYGLATPLTGVTYGVLGSTLSLDGTGVYGSSPMTGTSGIATGSGKAYGVYGNVPGNGIAAAGVYGLQGANPSGLGPSTSAGVRGDATDGFGVSGTSLYDYGVYGASSYAFGVYGTSSLAAGVQGQSPFSGTVGIATTGTGWGVYGQVNGSGNGVYGNNLGSGVGVKGTSSSGYAVQGISTSGDGGHFSTTGASGVYAENTASSGSGRWGVFGKSYSSSGIGVQAESASSGVGLLAKSASGDILQGENNGGQVFKVDNAGDVNQARAANGTVKAGVYATCSNNGNVVSISRSFNNVNSSAITIATGAAGPGSCTLNFNFTVSDRYVVAAPYNSSPRVVGITSVSGTLVSLSVWDLTGTGQDATIFVEVY